jgi:hypothetical protein
MNAKPPKPSSLLSRILGLAMLNIFIDLCLLPRASGHLLVDIVFWILVVIGVAIRDGGRTDSKNRRNGPRPPGPFWNKPSHAFLQHQARPFSETQTRIVLGLLLVPFGALAYLLLR